MSTKLGLWIAVTAVSAVGLATAQGASARALSVTAGPSGQACAIVHDARVVCWGENDAGQADPPHGRFRSLSAGRDFTCGIKMSRRLVCWGAPVKSWDSFPPRGRFRSVGAGLSNVCAVHVRGRPVCWGSNDGGEIDVPPGRYRTIEPGNFFGCGIHKDQEVTCWGSGQVVGPTPGPPPAGPFSQLSSGDDAACAVRPDGEAYCWGRWGHGAPLPLDGGPFVQVGYGYEWGCEIPVATAELECWGHTNMTMSEIPAGRFVSLDTPVRGDFACGVRRNGGIACWGLNPPLVPPELQ